MGRNKVQGRAYYEEQLRKAVKNFNAKVARLKKKNTAIVPHKLSFATIKRNAITFEDLQTEINEIKKFNQRGAEKAVKTLTKDNNTTVDVSEWEYKRAKRLAKRIDEQRKQQNQYLYDKYTGTRHKGGVVIRNAVDVRVSYYMERHEPNVSRQIENPKTVSTFSRNAKSLENLYYHENLKQMAERYRDNLIEAIKTVYTHDRAPREQRLEILRLIRGLSAEQIQHIYFNSNTEKSIVDISYYYDDPEDALTKIDVAIRTLQRMK